MRLRQRRVRLLSAQQPTCSVPRGSVGSHLLDALHCQPAFLSWLRCAPFLPTIQDVVDDLHGPGQICWAVCCHINVESGTALLWDVDMCCSLPCELLDVAAARPNERPNAVSLQYTYVSAAYHAYVLVSQCRTVVLKTLTSRPAMMSSPEGAVAATADVHMPHSRGKLRDGVAAHLVGQDTHTTCVLVHAWLGARSLRSEGCRRWAMSCLGCAVARADPVP